MQARLRPLALTIVAVAVLFQSPRISEAQGRGADRGGLLGLLHRDEVRQEVGLTEAQTSAIKEIEAKARPSREAIEPLFEKLREAETEEQRNAVRAEINALDSKLRREAEARLRDLLEPAQIEVLTTRVIRDRGFAALYDPFVQVQLGVSAEQVTQIEDLLRQREEAADRLVGATPEQYETFRQEWQSKTLVVLSAAQRTKWDAAAAPGEPDSRPVPVTAGTTASPSAAPAGPETASVSRQAESSGGTSDAGGEGKVIKFDAKQASAGSSARANQEEQLLSFNFRYAPWSEVLMLFADYANLTLDLDDVPPGTFNYYDSRKYTPTEALDVLNGYLLQKGYILVRRDHFLVCLNIDDGIPPNLIPNITADELSQRGKNELLNVVFPINGVPATNVAREVELLLGPQGKVVPLSTSNSLVVTDIGSNLLRIERLLATVSAAGPGDPIFIAYPLQHIDPLDAESIVKGQLGLTTGVQNVSESSFDRWRRQRDNDDDDRRRPSTPTTPTTQVASDARTNSLLVTATAAQHRVVEEVLKSTDVPAAAGWSRNDRMGEPFLRVYSLRRSEADEVAKTINALMPGIVVNEDDRHEKVHIHAPAAVQEEVAELIRQLDGEGSRGSMAVTVIPLAALDPYAAAATIRSLFAGDEEDAPIVEADSFGRRLLVRGTQDQVTQVKTLLAQLGEDGTGRAGGAYSSGPVRTIPLGGRDPEEMIPLLERLWETSSETPLRVVPSSPGSIIERRPLGRSPSEPADGPTAADTREAAKEPAANFYVLDQVVDESSTAGDEETGVSTSNESSSSQDEPTAAEAEEASPNAVDAADDPVALTVQGGNLVLASEDEEALNRLEDLVQRLGQVIPPRTKWTVFYLRAADATETAMLLEQLFPTSSVSMTAVDGGLMGSLSNGLSSFGGGLMSAAGLDSFGLDTQTLRIIPDMRSNSLFVTGPPDKIAEVEQVLNVLDASELPDSLRDRLPRMIDVKYADVEQVAEIVREVYKDYLQPANAAAMMNNPLALLMAGGGGNGRGGDRDRRNEPQGAIRLTVGVDAATSKLIVSADEALFRQIEDLVRSLDQAQLEAKRTVRVVTLENANASIVQSTLGSLIPKVRTSSTAERRSPNGSSNGNGTNGSSRSNDSPPSSSSGPSQEDQERIRRLMEMRARFAGGNRDGDRGDDRDRGRDGDRNDGRRSSDRGR